MGKLIFTWSGDCAKTFAENKRIRMPNKNSLFIARVFIQK
jgi:hypothetical protein